MVFQSQDQKRRFYFLFKQWVDSLKNSILDKQVVSFHENHRTGDAGLCMS